MVFSIAVPPFRLPDCFENTVPYLSVFYTIVRYNSSNEFSCSNFSDLSDHITPCLSSNFIPIEWRQHFKKCLLMTGFKCSFINSIPDTLTGFVNITFFFRGYSATRTISHPLGTFHRAYECCFLEKTVTTHTATKQRSFNANLNLCKEPFAERFL